MTVVGKRIKIEISQINVMNKKRSQQVYGFACCRIRYVYKRVAVVSQVESLGRVLVYKIYALNKIYKEKGYLLTTEYHREQTTNNKI